MQNLWTKTYCLVCTWSNRI